MAAEGCSRGVQQRGATEERRREEGGGASEQTDKIREPLTEVREKYKIIKNEPFIRPRSPLIH